VSKSVAIRSDNCRYWRQAKAIQRHSATSGPSLARFGQVGARARAKTFNVSRATVCPSLKGSGNSSPPPHKLSKRPSHKGSLQSLSKPNKTGRRIWRPVVVRNLWILGVTGPA
jgi:hypothetical protein